MARRRKKKGGSRRKTGWKMVKGALYVGAVAAPGVARLGGDYSSANVANMVKAYAFIDPSTNKFSLADGAQMWTPVAAVAVVDLVTSKIGLQRRIAQGIAGIF